MTLPVLIVAFGALVAAGIALLLGLMAVVVPLGLVAIPSHVGPGDAIPLAALCCVSITNIRA
ncbi:MAG TPA: hypothetical protein VEF89_00950 [Solirubrobacteraceae bacterium]|nr:hypothetical protein [Solirubrobacteraceae bacterium]